MNDQMLVEAASRSHESSLASIQQKEIEEKTRNLESAYNGETNERVLMKGNNI